MIAATSASAACSASSSRPGRGVDHRMRAPAGVLLLAEIQALMGLPWSRESPSRIQGRVRVHRAENPPEDNQRLVAQRAARKQSAHPAAFGSQPPARVEHRGTCGHSRVRCRPAERAQRCHHAGFERVGEHDTRRRRCRWVQADQRGDNRRSPRSGEHRSGTRSGRRFRDHQDDLGGRVTLQRIDRRAGHLHHRPRRTGRGRRVR